MTDSSTSGDTRLATALVDLVRDDCSGSCGNVFGVGLGCLFGLTVFKYWFINGIIDFSTALVLGAVASSAGLAVRLAAYVLVVPFFLGVRLTYYLVHPRHRTTLRAGNCPKSNLLSLDWFTVGILATGLPIALRHFGPWAGMNVVFLVGLFVLPRFVERDRPAGGVKLGTLAIGSGLFLYARYGGLLAAQTPIPAPATVIGPVATFRLPQTAVTTLVYLFNSLLVGPLVIAGLALVMNRLLTHRLLKTTPVLRHALPRRDPAISVVVSAAFGTTFYLLLVAVTTGQLMVLP
jgi:hypothetical protein